MIICNDNNTYTVTGTLYGKEVHETFAKYYEAAACENQLRILSAAHDQEDQTN